MTGYVDFFLLPVPKKHLTAYKRSANRYGTIMRRHGCLRYREYLQDDVNVPKFLSPLDLVKRKAGEIVIFAVTEFRSRRHRDQVNKKAMNDPQMKTMMNLDLFDCKRMAYGGFSTIVKFD